jgi:hypothetical protein
MWIPSKDRREDTLDREDETQFMEQKKSNAVLLPGRFIPITELCIKGT